MEKIEIYSLEIVVTLQGGNVVVGSLESNMLCGVRRGMYIITPTVVGVYRDWPGSSALNLYI